MTLQLDNVRKYYGDTRAVDGVSLELPPGETLALLGPSGCGKSTLLRLIAGLEPLDAGRIFLEREITRQPPQQRGFGMVFQDYALFPHLNVEKNISFGLVEKRWTKDAQRARVDELLALIGLPGYQARRVFELSGGQQQRVALARALAPKPSLLLLDEPLSNLDLALRDELKEQLRTILSHLEVSAIYVTHDQTEAFALADRVAVMRAGRVVQTGQTAELFAWPASAWVATFLGHPNIYATDRYEGLKYLIRPPLETPFILLRGDLIRLGRGDFSATLARHTQTGALHTLELTLEPFGLPLRWTGLTRELPEGLEPGQRVRLEIPKAAIVGLNGEAQ